MTKVRLVDGVGCEIEDGRWRMKVDMSPRSGGNGDAPDPGVYGRGALGSCLTVAYALWAARLGVPIDALTVEIHADYDSRGMYGIDGAVADYREIRFHVTVKSPATDEEILATLRAAETVGGLGEVVGTDISEVMVQAATAMAQERGHVHARFARMGAEALDLPDNKFHVALDALGLMYVPDPLAALLEMYRVLKPGGRAVACVWGARASCGWAEIFPIVDCRVNTDVCPAFFQLGTGTTLADAFRAAGFTGIHVDRIETRMHYESAEEALGAAFAGGPVAMAYTRFDDATRDDAHAEYLASIERYRDGTHYLIPGEFVVARGVR